MAELSLDFIRPVEAPRREQGSYLDGSANDDALAVHLVGWGPPQLASDFRA